MTHTTVLIHPGRREPADIDHRLVHGIADLLATIAARQGAALTRDDTYTPARRLVTTLPRRLRRIADNDLGLRPNTNLSQGLIDAAMSDMTAACTTAGISTTIATAPGYRAACQALQRMAQRWAGQHT